MAKKQNPGAGETARGAKDTTSHDETHYNAATTAAQIDLLGGAQRGRTRPRGFMEWTPDPSTRALLTQVNAVLEEYADHLPLTVRQIFYRLVGAHDYPKSEQAYKRLCRTLNYARRAGRVPMEAIRDDGGTILAPVTYDGVEDFLAVVRSSAENMRLDRTAGQPTRLVVMCEAAGMAPQLERVAEPYGITVMSSGGFDSVTDKYKFASELAADDTRPTEVLHIGDHDPSGAHMFLALAEDVTAFTRALGGEVDFTRLAVTPEQIAAYDLPTAPPKITDRRAFSGQTCQAEALAPNDLAEILRDAIDERLNERAYKRALRVERRARRVLMTRLGGRGQP